MDKAITKSIIASIKELPSIDHFVRVEEISKKAGISYGQLRENYPKLRLQVSGAVQAHTNRLKEIRIKNQIKLIRTTADKLRQEGVHLTHRTILKAAGLSQYADSYQSIRDVLANYIG